MVLFLIRLYFESIFQVQESYHFRGCRVKQDRFSWSIFHDQIIVRSVEDGQDKQCGDTLLHYIRIEQDLRDLVWMMNGHDIFRASFHSNENILFGICVLVDRNERRRAEKMEGRIKIGKNEI